MGQDPHLRDLCPCWKDKKWEICIQAFQQELTKNWLSEDKSETRRL